MGDLDSDRSITNCCKRRTMRISPCLDSGSNRPTVGAVDPCRCKTEACGRRIITSVVEALGVSLAYGTSSA